MLSSFSFKLFKFCLILAMYCSASSTDTWSVNGPLVSKSSARVDTVFLKSSDECNRSLLNFSCEFVRNAGLLSSQVCHVSHIDELVTRLQHLLLEMASTKLSDISNFMSVNAKK